MARDEKPNLPIRMNPEHLPPAVGLSGFELDMYRVQKNLYPAAPAAEDMPSGFSMRDVLMPLFRHKFMILFLFVLCSLASFLYVSSVPDTYVSEARIMYSEKVRDMVVNPTGEGGSFLTSDNHAMSNSGRAEMSILQSTKLAEQVVEQIGAERLLSAPAATSQAPQTMSVGWNYEQLNWFGRSLYWAAQAKTRLVKALNLTPPDLDSKQQAMMAFTRNLTVRPESPGSPILIISYSALNPKLAQDVLNSLMQSYEKTHNDLNRVANPAIFEKQMHEAETKLKEKQDQLAAERKKMGIVSLDAQKEMYVRELEDLKAKLDETQRQMQSANIQVTALSETLKKPTNPEQLTPGDARDPALDSLRQKIVDLRMQQIDLGKRYKAGSTPMRNLDDQIAELEGMMKKQATSSVKFSDPVRRQQELDLLNRKVELQVSQAHAEALSNALDKTRTEMNQLLANEMSIKRLEAEVENAYSDMQQSRKSYQIAKQADLFNNEASSNLMVMQDPTLPPISAKDPKKLLAILIFGMFAGLFGGGAMAFMMDFLNHTIRTNEDVEKWLGLPVLTAMPLARKHLPELREDVL